MTRRRRLLTAALGAVSLAGALALPAPPAAAAGPCWDDVVSDFDGGGPDVVVGLPSFDVRGQVDAGAIAVFSNVGAKGENNPVAPTERLLLTADDFAGLSSQAGARFGASVAVSQDAGAFDDPDDCADLLLGAPGQTVGGLAGAGQVYRLAGAPTGLGAVLDVFDESTLDGAGGPQTGAGFGSSLAVLTLQSIAVGVPGRDVGVVVDAGRVDMVDDSGGTKAHPNTVIEQGGKAGGRAEAGDRFGENLTLLPTYRGGLLVVGTPHEDIGGAVDAGNVTLVTPEGTSSVSQDSVGAGGASEAGDRYGAAVSAFWTFVVDQPVAVVAVGVPGEDLHGAADAGLVSYASFGLGAEPTDPIEAITGWARTTTQDSPGVAGSVEAGDRFGGTVLTGEFGRDSGRTDLVVGSPLEDLGSTANAGMITMTHIEDDGAARPGPQPGAWTQDSAGVVGAVEAGDRFGSAVTAVQLTTLEDDDDLVWPVTLVTVPREDVGGVVDAGMAYLGYAPGSGSVALSMPERQPGGGLGMVGMRMPLG